MEQILCKDIILIICWYIDNDRDKINFLSVCKFLHRFKNELEYNKMVPIKVVGHLWYFNSFTNIIIPEKIRYITNQMKLPPSLRKLTLSNFHGQLNFLKYLNITHLYITDNCRIDTYKLHLPDTLSHITWNINNEQQHFPAKSIPSSVTEICLGNYALDFIKLPHPEMISSLIIEKGYKFSLRKLITLPNLKKLVINSNDFIYGNKLPNTIEDLHLKGHCYFVAIDSLPNLIYFTFGGAGFLDLDLNLNLPPKLKVITVESVTNLPTYYPSGFEKIRIQKKLLEEEYKECYNTPTLKMLYEEEYKDHHYIPTLKMLYKTYLYDILNIGHLIELI